MHRRSLVRIAQRLQQRIAQCREFAFVFNLQAEYVLHIEDVHRAHAICCDMRRGDLQSLVADRRSDVVQQPGPVAPFTSSTVCVLEAWLSITTRGGT